MNSLKCLSTKEFYVFISRSFLCVYYIMLCHVYYFFVIYISFVSIIVQVINTIVITLKIDINSSKKCLLIKGNSIQISYINSI